MSASLRLDNTAIGGRNYLITSRDDGSLRITDDDAAAERLRIDSSGRLGIGTTSISSGASLQVGSGGANIAIGGDLATNGTGRLKFITSNTQTNWQISNNDNVAAAFEITPSTAAGGTTFTTPALLIDSSSNFKFNSGYGSAATAYGCRAWVNFNGTGTVSIRASGNVSSITDSGTGKYLANFSTSMPDAYYAAELTVIKDDAADNNDMYATIGATGVSGRTPTTTYVPITTTRLNTALVDCPVVNVVIVR